MLLGSGFNGVYRKSAQNTHQYAVEEGAWPVFWRTRPSTAGATGWMPKKPSLDGVKVHQRL